MPRRVLRPRLALVASAILLGRRNLCGGLEIGTTRTSPHGSSAEQMDRGDAPCPCPATRRQSVARKAIRFTTVGVRVLHQVTPSQSPVGPVRPSVQEFISRSALRLRNTIRRELGIPMARSDVSCVMVRETVSMVSPR